jgi:hypothetical protein
MRLAEAGSALAIALVLAGPAAAFCRTTTKASPADFSPTPDAPCFTAGLPLYWKSACVGFTMQQAGSRQISFDGAVQALTAGFARWRGASCPAVAGASAVSVDVRYLGPVACDKVEYNNDPRIGNANVIIFRDDAWPHDDPNNTLALTTVTYNPATGELYDADMEINTKEHKFTVSDPVPSDGVDFGSAITHEAGHFLGLAHSVDEHATMFARYAPGATTMRNLASDDVAGICSAYGPDATRSTGSGVIAASACDPTPRHGFASACGVPVSSGCTAAPTDRAPAPWLLGVAAAAIAAARVRARRAAKP